MIRAQSRLLPKSRSRALPVLHPLLLIFRLLPPIDVYKRQVTAPVLENGVAKAVRQYVLNRDAAE